jgi:hypothetical protein
MTCFNGLTRLHIATPTRGRTSVTPVTSEERAGAIAAASPQNIAMLSPALFPIDRDLNGVARREARRRPNWFGAAARALLNLIAAYERRA